MVGRGHGWKTFENMLAIFPDFYQTDGCPLEIVSVNGSWVAMPFIQEDMDVRLPETGAVIRYLNCDAAVGVIIIVATGFSR